VNRGAIISACGKFRYWLTREWDEERDRLLFIMLNPSTADAEEDDPTIRKCVGFAQRLGYGRLLVVNLYAYRATDPKALKIAGYPVGPENDTHIKIALNAANGVVCAWGVNARGLSRPAEVLSIIREHQATPMALRLTDDGIPWHPLMLPYTCTPVPLSRGTGSGEPQ
jgi:hypothetical protein